MVGIFAACFAVQTVARARQEETHGTAELLLSTPLSRVRWLGGVPARRARGRADHRGHGGGRGGAGSGIGSGATSCRMPSSRPPGRRWPASVFLGLTGLVFVVAPRATIAVGWSLVALATVLGLFGPLFGSPDWAVHLSPFASTPVLSEGAVDARGRWWLLLAAAAAVAASLALMRRRELATGG